MKKYKKINELDVLSSFGNIEVINLYFIPKPLIAQHLNTSLYQVNKICKTLILKQYLEANKIEPFHDIEYESGIDYGNNLSIWITSITQKGIDELKRNNLYHPWWEEINNL